VNRESFEQAHKNWTPEKEAKRRREDRINHAVAVAIVVVACLGFAAWFIWAASYRNPLRPIWITGAILCVLGSICSGLYHWMTGRK
jgi:fatty acid desaturase